MQQLIYAKKNFMNTCLPACPEWGGSFAPVILTVYALYNWVKYAYTPDQTPAFHFRMGR